MASTTTNGLLTAHSPDPDIFVSLVAFSTSILANILWLVLKPSQVKNHQKDYWACMDFQDGTRMASSKEKEKIVDSKFSEVPAALRNIIQDTIPW